MLATVCGVQTTHQTAHGQLLDITTAPIGTVDLSKYTEETYLRIVTFKTAFYSFYLPVVCGLLVGGINSDAAFATAKDICVQMGQYFQVCLCQCCVVRALLSFSTEYCHSARKAAATHTILWLEKHVKSHSDCYDLVITIT